MRFLSVTSLALVALLIAACTSGGAPSSAPSASAAASGAPAGGGTPTVEDLAGRSFVATAAEGYEIVPDSQIVLEFGDEGRIGIQAGCNTMGSQFGIENGLLTMGQMISTEMACAPALMAQDQFLSTFLYNATITLDGDTLTLSKDGTSMTFVDREVAQPDLPLEGTTWVVNAIVDTTAVSSMPAGVTATLVFADGQVQVNAGCNTGSGSAAIAEDTITFGPIATTRMACDDATMNAEGAILAVLQGEVDYEIESSTLTLTGDANGMILNAQQ